MCTVVVAWAAAATPLHAQDAGPEPSATPAPSVSTTAPAPTASPTAESDQQAGEDERVEAPPKIRLARGTWDTGWFQAEVHRQLLMQIGYEVVGPTTMDNPDFFAEVGNGQVDMWANGWFPLHEPQLQPGSETVGTQVSAGAVTGYFVDLATAREHDITDLTDLADPDIASLFDTDGNGQADLLGCNTTWACGPQVSHHIETFGLSETVEQVQADYSALMTEAVSRHRDGEPILLYGFTPHWVLDVLAPGEDLRWIEVPGADLPDQPDLTDEDTLVADLPGCASNPCQTGFPPNDIRSVANSDFLEANPEVRRLLELVTIPLADIQHQNAQMFAGEGSADDIRRQASEWISDHQTQVDEWVAQAAPNAVPVVDTPGSETMDGDVLRVAVRTLEPFVLYEQRTFAGYSVELAEAVGQRLGRPVEVYGVNSVAKQLDDVGRGVADIAVAAISITSEREEQVDFTLPVFQSGLTVMVPTERSGGLLGRAGDLLGAIVSSGLPWMILAFIVVLLVSAHAIWWFERRENPDFPHTYHEGIWDSFWWATVTITTVGYGDKTPRGRAGQGFALIWMIVGYFVFASFTASITSSLAVSELRGEITGPSTLQGHDVGTLANSEAEDWLISEGIGPVAMGTVDSLYTALEDGEIEAIVFDAPVLQYKAARDSSVRTVGPVFDNVRYGIALHDDDAQLREALNLALLELIESGAYQDLSTKWFGDLEN